MKGLYSGMSESITLKDDYTLARCCSPQVGSPIVGYYSHDNILKVHCKDCANLAKAEQSRLVTLAWDDIIAKKDFTPGEDFASLDDTDFAVLLHHQRFGIDYSLKVASMIHQDKQAVFDCHRKLRSMGLVQRVEATMVRYRKGVVDNKWIKHRNHTYYDLTEKGRKYIDYHRSAL
jgi:hypothetical protein